MFDFQVGMDRNRCQKPQVDDENLGRLWLEGTRLADVDGKGVQTLRQREKSFSYLRLKGYSLGGLREARKALLEAMVEYA
jgi:hypothetical protein